MNNNIKTPSLSVVIPVFNEHKTIEKIFNRVYNNQLVSEIIFAEPAVSAPTIWFNFSSLMIFLH